MIYRRYRRRSRSSSSRALDRPAPPGACAYRSHVAATSYFLDLYVIVCSRRNADLPPQIGRMFLYSGIRINKESTIAPRRVRTGRRESADRHTNTAHTTRAAVFNNHPYAAVRVPRIRIHTVTTGAAVRAVERLTHAC